MPAPAAAASIADEVRRGLARTPKQLPCRYFYDVRGSELFDRITRLPEYYLTRAESEILEANARDIVERAHPASMLELGSGFCAKTRILIDAARAGGTLHHFQPLDISAAVVREVAQALAREHPGLVISGIVGDFMDALETIEHLGRTVVLFLGSTIGNLDRAQRSRFFRQVAAFMRPGDSFLLGVDLIKDEAILNAAYNDAQGVTAEFNRNLLRVLNRELGANFDLSAYQHVARYDSRRHQVEMWLRSRRAQRVALPRAGIEITLSEGEMILTEISVKFSREMVVRELQEAGLRTVLWRSDHARRFGLALAESR